MAKAIGFARPTQGTTSYSVAIITWDIVGRDITVGIVASRIRARHEIRGNFARE